MTTPEATPTIEDRIRDYAGVNHGLIPRGDVLAIIGKKHPARAAIEAMPCLGNHKVGYCAGVVVSKADAIAYVRAALDEESQP